jgi:hypothetical protein
MMLSMLHNWWTKSCQQLFSPIHQKQIKVERPKTREKSCTQGRDGLVAQRTQRQMRHRSATAAKKIGRSGSHSTRTQPIDQVGGSQQQLGKGCSSVSANNVLKNGG